MPVPTTLTSMLPESRSAAGGSAETDLSAQDDLATLYENHSAAVRQAVIHLGGGVVDVDDLVQDVFIVILRKRHSFEGRSQLSTWVYGIVVRVVSRARQRARLRRFLRLDQVAEPAHSDTPARFFEHREASETVFRILERISEQKRVVFVLYELEGLSGQQIAEIVGCPMKTVWTRLHHARKEFKQHLARENLRSAAREGGGA